MEGWCFNSYSGLFLSGMIRLADVEMTVLKEEVFTSRFLEIEGMACHTGPNGEVPGPVRGQRT